MTREEFINKLQECYFGNKTAFNEIIKHVNELKNIAVEHKIMKKFICENDLWEKFLNYDDFVNWLKKDDNLERTDK